jgi:iron uptake system EfeUOB component EfeO/EfeM
MRFRRPKAEREPLLDRTASADAGCDSAGMTTKSLLTATIALLAIAMPARAAEKTASEKTSEAWDATKKTTKDVTNKVVKKTKEVVSAAEAAVTKPDADAHQVNVTVTDSGVQMPSNLKAGKTAFIVKNTGKQGHNFQVAGSGLNKSFWFDVPPNETKIMQADLKPGTYEADCQVKEHAGKEKKVQLTVK